MFSPTLSQQHTHLFAEVIKGHNELTRLLSSNKKTRSAHTVFQAQRLAQTLEGAMNTVASLFHDTLPFDAKPDTWRFALSKDFRTLFWKSPDAPREHKGLSVKSGVRGFAALIGFLAELQNLMEKPSWPGMPTRMKNAGVPKSGHTPFVLNTKHRDFALVHGPKPETALIFALSTGRIPTTLHGGTHDDTGSSWNQIPNVGLSIGKKAAETQWASWKHNCSLGMFHWSRLLNATASQHLLKANRWHKAFSNPTPARLMQITRDEAGWKWLADVAARFPDVKTPLATHLVTMGEKPFLVEAWDTESALWSAMVGNLIRDFRDNRLPLPWTAVRLEKADVPDLAAEAHKAFA